MRTRKINAKDIFKPVFKIKYGGRVLGEIRDISILSNADRIKSIVTEVFRKHLGIILEEMVSVMERDAGAHSRNLISGGQKKGESVLLEAYREAAKSPVWEIGKNGVRMGFIDTQVLDTMLPRSDNSVNREKGGWWRIHEEGSPGGLVGQSMTHQFVTAEHIRSRMGDRAWPNIGRTNEGIMVEKNSPFGEFLGVKSTFRGVKPKRILRGMQLYFRRSFAAAKPNIMTEIAQRIAGGAVR